MIRQNADPHTHQNLIPTSQSSTRFLLPQVMHWKWFQSHVFHGSCTFCDLVTFFLGGKFSIFQLVGLIREDGVTIVICFFCDNEIGLQKWESQNFTKQTSYGLEELKHQLLIDAFLSWAFLRRGAPGIGKSDFAMERLTLGWNKKQMIKRLLKGWVLFVIILSYNHISLSLLLSLLSSLQLTTNDNDDNLDNIYTIHKHSAFLNHRFRDVTSDSKVARGFVWRCLRCRINEENTMEELAWSCDGLFLGKRGWLYFFCTRKSDWNSLFLEVNLLWNRGQFYLNQKLDMFFFLTDLQPCCSWILLVLWVSICHKTEEVIRSGQGSKNCFWSSLFRYLAIHVVQTSFCFILLEKSSLCNLEVI